MKSLFEKRHFEWLASYAKNLDNDEKKKLAAELTATNPNFDKDRFLKACNTRGGEGA